MKILIISFASCLLLILPNYYHVTEGQNVLLPTAFYKTTVFEKINRGGYNITDCLKELLNCWEFIKPDIICIKNKYEQYKTTACEVLKETCDDYTGLIEDNFGTRLTMFETTCLFDYQSEYTK
ncbi:uncharacterized protein LOC111364984 [Spodoptera litura]|uniref:Uncharacterized protein LOC111364984 n=1 Tax=Spodoptera litura TaxID=69820 RepID=A0A9J7EUP5_SPOLT|nr:uncharacterized protein LOC111364984 [Spodoptera litura]